MKAIIIFIFVLSMAGCSTVRVTEKETEKEIPVVIASPVAKDSIGAKVNDSTIVAHKAVKNDTTASVVVSFDVSDSVPAERRDSVKAEVKKHLKALQTLPINPVVNYAVKPDSVHGNVKVKEKEITVTEKLSITDYLQISGGFVLAGFIIGISLKFRR